MGTRHARSLQHDLLKRQASAVGLGFYDSCMRMLESIDTAWHQAPGILDPAAGAVRCCRQAFTALFCRQTTFTACQSADSLPCPHSHLASSYSACCQLCYHSRVDRLPCRQVYSQLEGPSHVVNTAWAMLALLAAGQHTLDTEPLHRAALCLLRSQLASGDWPQQHISGVFNRNCMIAYANYRCAGLSLPCC